MTGVLADGTPVTERFVVRPGPVDPSADVQPPGVVATILGERGSRIVTNANAFLDHPAYLVSGVAVPLSLSVPLRVPIDETTASGQAIVDVSTITPFEATGADRRSQHRRQPQRALFQSGRVRRGPAIDPTPAPLGRAGSADPHRPPPLLRPG